MSRYWRQRALPPSSSDERQSAAARPVERLEQAARDAVRRRGRGRDHARPGQMPEQRAQLVAVAAEAADQLAGGDAVATVPVRRRRDPVGEPAGQPLVDLLALDEVDVERLVAVLREQQRAGRLPVAAGAPGLLVVGLERGRHARVDHRAHVGLVDAHAERVGGARSPAPRPRGSGAERPRAGPVEPGVVGHGRLPERVASARRRSPPRPPACPRTRSPAGRPARAAPRRSAARFSCAAGPGHREGEVGPVEARRDAQRVAQAEPLRDVARHARRGGRGGRDDRPRRRAPARRRRGGSSPAGSRGPTARRSAPRRPRTARPRTSRMRSRKPGAAKRSGAT